MLDSIHKQGYYIQVHVVRSTLGASGVKIQQINSATFLRLGTWVATVTSTAAIGQL